MHDNAQIVQALLDKGADLARQDAGVGWHSLAYATCHDNRKVTELLLDLNDARLLGFPGNPFMEPQGPGDLCILSNYAEYGRPEALRWAYEKYPKIIEPAYAKQSSIGYTMACWACGPFGSVQALKEIVDIGKKNGVDILSFSAHVTDKRMKRVMRIFRIINWLGGYRPKGMISICLYGFFGNSPLHVASYHGSIAVVEYILATGAIDPNSTNSFNYANTPLICAAMNGHDEICKRLLAAGAELDRTDKHGKTAHWWALRMGHDELAATLFVPKAAKSGKAKYQVAPAAPDEKAEK